MVAICLRIRVNNGHPWRGWRDGTLWARDNRPSIGCYREKEKAVRVSDHRNNTETIDINCANLPLKSVTLAGSTNPLGTLVILLS